MRFLFHPDVVHFPVALWLTSFFFDLAYARTRQPVFQTAARYLIGLGLVGALVAIGTGFVDYVALVKEGVGATFLDLHRVHSALAYGATAAYAGIFVARWRWRAMRMTIYLLTALIAAIMIAVNAILGAVIRQML